MQESLKRLLTELHNIYFKPNGFMKQRQRFRRDVDIIMQEVEFQSSQWNGPDAPLRFYVNISFGFSDILMKDGHPALTGMGRIAGLVLGAPPEFDLTTANYESVRSQLLLFLPQALSALPKHYDDVRSRAKAGWHTPIPLPETWKTEQKERG